MPIDFKSALAFGPSLVLWHVEQGTKQTLAHVLRDMHDIKAVRHTVDLPVRQVQENRPRFPYLQQRLWRLSLLPRLWRLLLLSRSGQSFQFFNSSSISSPLLVHGRLRGSVSSSNRSLRFFHARREATFDVPCTRFLKTRDLYLAGDTLCHPCT